MPIVEIQTWKQTVLDRQGRIVAQREVSLIPNVSNIRQEAEKFLRYVLQNNGDLQISVEAELRDLQKHLAELLKRMNSSRDADEIRRLRAPITVVATLAPYLEHLLTKAKLMTAGEFTAESLEAEAAKLPPSKQEDAEVLRRAAQIYRESGGPRTIRVWELPNDDSEK